MDDRKEPGPQSFFCEAGIGESNGEVVGTVDPRKGKSQKGKASEGKEGEAGKA